MKIRNKPIVLIAIEREINNDWDGHRLYGRAYNHPMNGTRGIVQGGLIYTSTITCRRNGFIYTRNTKYAPISDALYQ